MSELTMTSERYKSYTGETGSTRWENWYGQLPLVWSTLVRTLSMQEFETVKVIELKNLQPGDDSSLGIMLHGLAVTQETKAFAQARRDVALSTGFLEKFGEPDDSALAAGAGVVQIDLLKAEEVSQEKLSQGEHKMDEAFGKMRAALEAKLAKLVLELQLKQLQLAQAQKTKQEVAGVALSKHQDKGKGVAEKVTKVGTDLEQETVTLAKTVKRLQAYLEQSMAMQTHLHSV